MPVSLEVGGIVLALLGWAYQLGFQGAALRELSEAIKILQTRLTAHHEDISIHVSAEWRQEMREGLRALSEKLDRLASRVNYG